LQREQPNSSAATAASQHTAAAQTTMAAAYEAAASTVLSSAGILHQVFSFLPGCWLYIGPVCRDWSALYADMKDHQIRSLECNDYPKVVTLRRSYNSI
jgi:hypothetical protein